MSCLGHNQASQPATPLTLNHGYFPYVNTVYRWKNKPSLTDRILQRKIPTLADPEAMRLEFLKIFESQAGVYPYWFGDQEGLTLVLAVPNQAFKDNRDKKEVVLGLEQLDEITACKAATDILAYREITEKEADTLETAIIQLYEQGYVLCKKTDREQTKP
jgi:hypothetical protein